MPKVTSVGPGPHHLPSEAALSDAGMLPQQKRLASPAFLPSIHQICTVRGCCSQPVPQPSHALSSWVHLPALYPAPKAVPGTDLLPGQRPPARNPPAPTLAGSPGQVVQVCSGRERLGLRVADLPFGLLSQLDLGSQGESSLRIFGLL